MMPVKKRILVAIVLVIAAAAFYIYKEFNRTNINIASEQAAFTLTASELINEFNSNDSSAGKKYVGKVIAVSGRVKNTDKDERGYYTVSLGDSSSMSSVRCSIDSMYTDRVTAIRPGMTVTIKGNCTGYNADELLGLDVIVNRCVVETR